MIRYLQGWYIKPLIFSPHTGNSRHPFLLRSSSDYCTGSSTWTWWIWTAWQWERSDRVFAIWVKNLLRNSPQNLVGKLASCHCPGTPAAARRLKSGAFNVCYEVTFTDGSHVVVRLAALGRTVARTEKVENEISMMDFLDQHTKIPVPKVLGHGKSTVGPYIVMSYLEGNPLSAYLTVPSEETVADSLNPDISIHTLKRAYFGMAGIILELSKPTFPLIGAITKDGNDWIVSKRPLTLKMSRIAQFSNVPHKVFKQGPFNNAIDYFDELAQQHLLHLEHQRNDAVTGEADCQKKYIARCLFRKCSREMASKLEHCNGPFRIFCDDLNPGNVLVDPSILAKVTGVVDWEFSYTAPAEFAYAAPWWLLLQRPEAWDEDLDQFLTVFMPRFHTFIEALQDCETLKISDGSLEESQRISPIMAKSLDNGLFWFCLALRHGAMFDDIYWKFIDQKFFGSFTTIEDRLQLLSLEERQNMDSFVEMKLSQAKEGTLVIHYDVDEMCDL